MSLLKKKCEYCSGKIEKGKESLKNVKVPGIIGTKEKPFCCSDHGEKYKKEVEEHLKHSHKGGHCC